ncbi:carboxymuconolactone decarboxylase family protein [Asticcacaulis sp. W401b]|uniref:carboxymuconolactone decarboxylase family protein n=1 Tax=Asticcacaulis sp. W401b TaxID=3388666 RepID=UPI003970D164
MKGNTSQLNWLDRHVDATLEVEPAVTTNPVDYYKNVPNVFASLEKVHGAIDEHDLDRMLHHLVQLRASQINACAYCVKMHTKEARDDGETNERLDRLAVWEHVNDFSAKERAALGWTEALTQLDRKTDYGALRAELRQHFSDAEISALTATIAMINLWNRIQVSTH